MIKIKNLKFKFPGDKGLENINLNLEKGLVYGLVGTNGAGKTTLLKIIAGLYKTKGEVELLGNKNYKTFLKYISFYEEITKKNYQVEFRQLLNIYKDKDYFDYGYFINKLNQFNIKVLDAEETYLFPNYMLKDLSNSKSRGQSKILNIIFALSFKYNIFLLDEPLSNLDIINKDKILKLILEKANNDNLIMISSHELDTLEEKIDKVIFIDNKKIRDVVNVEDIRNNEKKTLTDYFVEVFKKEGENND